MVNFFVCPGDPKKWRQIQRGRNCVVSQEKVEWRKNDDVSVSS